MSIRLLWAAEIRLRMMTANTAELLRLLDEGEIDFAIVEGFFQKQFYESLPYKRERYLAVCAPAVYLIFRYKMGLSH